MIIDRQIESEMRKVDDYDQELLAKLDDIGMDSSDDEARFKNASASTKLMIKVRFCCFFWLFW